VIVAANEAKDMTAEEKNLALQRRVFCAAISFRCKKYGTNVPYIDETVPISKFRTQQIYGRISKPIFQFAF